MRVSKEEDVKIFLVSCFIWHSCNVVEQGGTPCLDNSREVWLPVIGAGKLSKLNERFTHVMQFICQQKKTISISYSSTSYDNN